MFILHQNEYHYCFFTFERIAINVDVQSRHILSKRQMSKFAFKSVAVFTNLTASKHKRNQN